MLYSCPTQACVEVVRERARMLQADTFTPNKAPEASKDIASTAIDLALSGTTQLNAGQVRQDMIKAAALMIQAIERFDQETRVEAEPQKQEA